MKITVSPSDSMKDVSLGTNKNVDYFTVSVKKPNGEEVPVKGGKVE